MLVSQTKNQNKMRSIKNKFLCFYECNIIKCFYSGVLLHIYVHYTRKKNACNRVWCERLRTRLHCNSTTTLNNIWKFTISLCCPALSHKALPLRSPIFIKLKHNELFFFYCLHEIWRKKKWFWFKSLYVFAFLFLLHCIMVYVIFD